MFMQKQKPGCQQRPRLMPPSPQAWRTQSPLALFLLARMSCSLCLLVFSTLTHTEETSWDILRGCRIREPALSQAFRISWNGLSSVVKRPQIHLATVTRYPLTRLPILAFCRASNKANATLKCSWDNS